MVSERRRRLSDRFHPFVERHAVRQVGERIVVRQMLDFFLGAQPLGDVLVGGDPAAVRDRLVDDGNDPAIGQVRDLAEGLSLRDRGQKFGPIGLDTVGAKAAGRDALIEDLPNGATRV